MPAPHPLLQTAEGQRLADAMQGGWRRWGPYPSDRQWGTVREDYSPGGDAWDYFPFEHARSRAYRWGEDAIAGFSDDQLNWCVGLGLWNGHDPILKERLFGLTNEQGNHGEDVKELYFYTDATPTHSYLSMLYKYPQAAFPYRDLREENARRDQTQPEYEILDTGVFEDGRYFDVTVEYAKAAPDDILMRITVVNRAAYGAVLHVLPQLWARNIWSWEEDAPKPRLSLEGGTVQATHPAMPPLAFAADAAGEWIFCENETNDMVVFGVPNPDGFAGPFKDGIGDYVVTGREAAIRRDGGTRCARHVRLELAAHGRAELRLRLAADPGFDDFDAVFTTRRREADIFYGVLQRGIEDADSRLVQRQALAGMIWSKQFYGLDLRRWLSGDPAQPPPPPEREHGRNADWEHLNQADIFSMPDKWEYPWYASWDLAFHAVTFALIDTDFAKHQLLLLLRDRAMHPNGQIPAYEWKFEDANPPVQAWAAWRIYQMDAALMGVEDHMFLTRVFHKLLLNFGWWVNRKDAQDRNIFQGGFLGLDNIEIFNRSAPLPTGGTLEQSDGTAWMAAYALHMMRIALELAETDPGYQDIAAKFFEHFLYISAAMGAEGGAGLWDEQDSFFYDALRLPDGRTVPLRVRSVVGLIPLFAVHALEPALVEKMPYFRSRIEWFFQHRPDLAGLVSHWHEHGEGERHLLALLRAHRMTGLLRHMLDETEFLSDYGVRAVSKFHEKNPYVFRHDGQEFGVSYVPAESDSRLFGGNSNWRGPIWIPINYLLVESLFEFHRYYGDGYTIEYPTGSGRRLTLRDVAAALAQRITKLSLKGPDGHRPVMAAYPALQADPLSEDLVLFHEYYHGDTGRGVGASHQTGWSGLVALLLQPRREQTEANVPGMGDGS